MKTDQSNMKKFIRFAFAIIATIMLFSACSTDFEINGNYEESTVVYSILNPKEQYQYIRINRAFLGEGNALLFAQIPDSTLFPYLLEVKLFGLNESGQIVYESPIADTIMVYKESDVFFTGYYPLYRIKINSPAVVSMYSDTLWLNPDYTYKLKIVNPETGNIVESTTPIISNFSIDLPYSVVPINFIEGNSGTVKWKTPEYGKRYEVKFKFNYYEIYDAAPNDTIPKSIEWIIGTTTASSIIGGEEIIMSFQNDNFYYLLGNQIESRTDVKRYVGKMDLFVTAGTEELSTYITINSSSNSIIQERPQFTNVSNGIGIFASKSINKTSYKVGSNTVNAIRNNENTSDLNFQNITIY